MLDVSFGAIVIILAALAFDLVNGFHDAANSIATGVWCRRACCPLPSSSSHALVGGLAGAAIAFSGLEMLEGPASRRRRSS